jgi:hypothetical protein
MIRQDARRRRVIAGGTADVAVNRPFRTAPTGQKLGRQEALDIRSGCCNVTKAVLGQRKPYNFELRG